MYTDSRLRPLWILVVFGLLIGMSCSLFSGGAESSQMEGETIPTSMPTPEGVSQADLPIPVPADVANFSSSQASFSYTTQLSVEEVASFYQEKLPLEGWTIKQQGDMGGTLMWEIVRPDVSYLLVIMPSNGMTVVNAGPLQ